MTNITEIKGIAYWAEVQTPGQYDTYSLIVGELDEDNTKIVKDSQISHRFKDGPDNSGETYGGAWVRVSRKQDKGKPVIVGPDGITPFRGLIGNGSEVRVKIKSWNSKGAYPPGHEILAVQVLKLVEYGKSPIQEGDQAFDDASGDYEALPSLDQAVSEVEFGDAE